jgi:hypothetical protein
MLLDLLERVLGNSYTTAHENHAFSCPNNCHPTKNKLEVNLKTFQYQCWVCGSKKLGLKGKSIQSLFKTLRLNSRYFEELKNIIPSHYNNDSSDNHTPPVDDISLPKETKYFENLSLFDIEGKHALSYVLSRGLSYKEIIKYKIGYCESGKYSGYLIIPIYDNTGDLIFFSARSFQGHPNGYKNPKVSRNLIANELDINWWLPIVLCEGIFDYFSIKRNCIPLLGKDFQPVIYETIIQKSQNKHFYIVLDPDAKNEALRFSQNLLNDGFIPHLVELDNLDPNEIGFNNINKIIYNSPPLDLEKIMRYKIK